MIYVFTPSLYCSCFLRTVQVGEVGQICQVLHLCASAHPTPGGLWALQAHRRKEDQRASKSSPRLDNLEI